MTVTAIDRILDDLLDLAAGQPQAFTGYLAPTGRPVHGEVHGPGRVPARAARAAPLASVA